MSTFIRTIPLLITLALMAYPIGRIYRRLGHSPWWGLACFIPLGFVPLLWYIALTTRRAETS